MSTLPGNHGPNFVAKDPFNFKDPFKEPLKEPFKELSKDPFKEPFSFRCERFTREGPRGLLNPRDKSMNTGAVCIPPFGVSGFPVLFVDGASMSTSESGGGFIPAFRIPKLESQLGPCKSMTRTVYLLHGY